ncbi:hypothetical protein P700755_003060 [Psychroflexus torquis ATCC 700755]|uniref:Uncharacterized protein n=1 Tax=Psychroflexus torquis (strain ATCC 700755 / CIP 106069 / ACAM 623) TaxID=313595 RepID=K4IW86_PSYTT|nr:hypothetical protein P700755_003060 [Psychroflexus torquis ATCC 700755]
MLVIFDFNQKINQSINQSKNNSIYSYGIINIIWYDKGLSYLGLKVMVVTVYKIRVFKT